MRNSFKGISAAAVVAVAGTSLISPVSAESDDTEFGQVTFNSLDNQSYDYLNILITQPNNDAYDKYFNTDGSLAETPNTIEINGDKYDYSTLLVYLSAGDSVEEAIKKLDPVQKEITVDSVSANVNDDNSVTVSGQVNNGTAAHIVVEDADGNEVLNNASVDLDKEGNFELTTKALDAGENTVKVMGMKDGEHVTEFTTKTVTVESPAVESVSAINATTVEVTFAEDASLEETDLEDTTIALSVDENTTKATYKAESLNGNKASFVLSKDNSLVSGTKYTVSSDDFDIEGMTVTYTESDSEEDIANVEQTIEDLTTEGNLLENGDAILAAQKAFNDLTDEGQNSVNDDAQKKLDSQVSQFQTLTKSEASGVVQAVNNAETVEDMQSVVTEAEKNLETSKALGMDDDTYDHYMSFVQEGQKLVDNAQDDVDKAVDQAEKAINALPNPEDVTLENFEDVQDQVGEANKLIADAKELDGDASFDTKIIDQLESKISDVQSEQQEKIDEAVNKAQDAINNLSKPEDVTQDNLEEAQDEVANAKELVADAKELDENVVFYTYPMDQLEDKITALVTEKNEKIDQAVNKAQDAINELPKPEDVTADNLQDAKDQVNDAKDLVKQAHNLDSNVVFYTYPMDQLEDKIAEIEAAQEAKEKAIQTAQDAISKIGDPANFSLDDLEDDAAKVQNAADKVKDAKDIGVKESDIGNYDHFKLAQDRIDELKDKMEAKEQARLDAKTALTNLPIKQNITLNDEEQVNEARKALNEATGYESVKEDDFRNVWKLDDAEAKIKDLQETLDNAKQATSDLEDLVASTDKVETLVNDGDKRQEASEAFREASNAIQKVIGEQHDDLMDRSNAANDIILATSHINSLQDKTGELTADNIFDANIKLTSAEGAVGSLSDGDIKDALSDLVNTEADKIENFEAANEVSSLIKELPEAEGVQTKHKEQIENARSAYDDLSDAQQKLVKNVDKLTDAENAYQDLQEEAILNTIDSLSDANKPEQVKPTLQKLADITSDNEDDAKFNMDTFNEDNASDYLIAFGNQTVESVSDVKNLVKDVNDKVSAETKYEKVTEVENISNKNVSFEGSSFDVPYDVDSFAFDDGDAEVTAEYADGEWTFKTAATDLDPTVEDKKAANKVADKITSLPDGNPLENGDALVDAQEAYENLTDAQKDLVSEEDTNTLDSAVDTYISLSKSSASGVVKKITNEKNIEKKQKIVNNAQNNLDTAKQLGMSQDVYDHHQGFIDEAQKLVDTAKEDKNQAAADKVADKITSLPDGNPLENGDALVEAQEAYENLTDVQKGLVSNEDKNTLDSAVQQYITLSKGSAQGAVDKVTSEKNIEKKQKIVNNAQNNLDTAKQLGMSQDVYDHHQGFIDEAQKLVDTAKEDKNQAAADKVADKITGLPDGNPLENGDALVDAQEAYENLTDAQKDLVSEEDTNTLDSAVDTYISLSKSSASGVVKKITNEKNIEKKQKIVNNAQDNLDTAKELGMSEDAYDHNQGFIDEAQKLVDTAKENSTEAKYNANGSVENIPDNVAYTDGKFTVPKGVESFEFTDKGRTVTANYKDGKWIFSQDGFDQTPANSYFTATSSTDLDAENVTVDYGEDKSVKFSVATETKDNEANEMTFTFDNVDGDSFDTSNLDGEFEFNANEETYTAVKEDDGWTVYTEEQIAAQDLQAAKDTVSGTDFSNLEIKGETAGNKKSAVEGVIEGLDLAEGVTAEVNEDGSNVTLSTDGAEDVTVETGAKFHLTQAAGTLKTLKQKIVEYENKDQFANIEIQDEQDSTKESAVAGVIDHLVAGNGATNSVSKTGENTYEFTLTADNADDVTVTVEASFDLTQAAQDLQAAKDTVSGTDFSNLEIKGETAGNKKSAVEGVIEGLDLAEGVTAEVNEDGSNVTLSTDGAEDVTVETGAKFHLTQAAGTLKTLKQKIVEYENKDQFANIEIQDEQDSTKESAVAGVIDHLVAGNGATNSVSKTGENTYEFALTADNADDVTVTINASFKVIK